MISSCIYFYRWHFYSFLTFKNLLYFYLFVCVCKLEDNLWKSVLFFYHMGPGYGLRPSGLVTISLGWAISTLTAQFHSSLCSFVERYTCHGAIACWRRTRSACCRIFGISYQGKRMALGERSSLCSDFAIFVNSGFGHIIKPVLWNGHPLQESCGDQCNDTLELLDHSGCRGRVFSLHRTTLWRDASMCRVLSAFFRILLAEESCPSRVTHLWGKACFQYLRI